jgi:hypothetical protein
MVGVGGPPPLPHGQRSSLPHDRHPSPSS